MFEALLLAANIWTSNVPPTAAQGTYLQLDAPVGVDTWLSPDIWSIPIYSSSSSDPKRPLLYNPQAWSNVAAGRWQRAGNRPAIEQEILAGSLPAFPITGNVFSSISPYDWVLPTSFKKTPTTSTMFHVANDALPAPGPDGHMAVMQPDKTVLETYGTIVLSTGQIIALSYSVSDLHSLGDGYQNGQTASMIPSYLGVIDDSEITAGKIDHAMAITLPARFLTTQIAYPAFAYDRNALTQTPPYSGPLPMGARLAIPAKLDLNDLHLRSPAGQAIAAAAQQHGFIVVDRGGEGITLRIRHNAQQPADILHHWNADLQADLQAIFSHVVVVAQP